MAHEFQTAKVSIGIHRNKKVFVTRHPQRDEIRGEFETDPIFSKLIDFACRALLGALARARFWPRHGLWLPKDVKLPDPWHKKVSNDRVVCHRFGAGNRIRSHQMLSKARREF